MSYNSLLDNVRYLKGVGPKRAEELGRLQIKTLKELLYYFPRRYEDRRKLEKISALIINRVSLISGEVIATYSRKSRRGMNIFEAFIDDKSGVIISTWFNQGYLSDIIKKGQRILLFGRIDYYKKLRILAPDFEILDEREPILGILPIYSLSAKLTQKFMRKIIKIALADFSSLLSDFLPLEIRRKLNLPDIVNAIYSIHFPEDENIIIQAQQRFALEEMFLLQVALGLKKTKRKSSKNGIAHKFDFDLRKSFLNNLPFKLTKDQEKVFDQIEIDMAKDSPMKRLLQGEVGTGKTVVASYASLLASSSGYQTAIMVPTEILAQQQYVKIARILAKFDIEVGILIGNMDKDYEKELKQDLRNGNIDVVIGTHALISEDVVFNNLGLVIVDEQHKFGVRQRMALRCKAKAPDYLIMTATPIPRTLALTLFGDMDISTMKESPFGEKKTSTYWVEEARRKNVYEFLKKMVQEGMQGFVVCPRIEEDSLSEVKAVEQVYKEVVSILGPGKAFLLHGKMLSLDKKKIIAEFEKGIIKVLVSTIVIEVGIDVPDASIMIVEEANRFGLSQLHQLRGRVGRSGQRSYCVLIADANTKEATKRLKTMVETEDGFKISEQDLEIRGFGEIFGISQHGFMDMRFQYLGSSMDLLDVARYEAFALIENDPHLKSSSNVLLKRELLLRFPAFLK